MPTSAAVFDQSIERWNAEQSLPWNALKYRLALAQLARHMAPGAQRILDAGGGNGQEAISLAAQGHQVTIVDYSKEMLADAERRAAAAGVAERVTLQFGSVRDVPRLFPEIQFDVVVCHNVVQYVDDVPALLRELTGALKPGGLLSILSINRYSIPLRIAFPHGDLAEALAQVDARGAKAMLFDAPMNCYSAAEMVGMLGGAGCVSEGDYGIRCVCDYWGDNELKSDPAIFKQLEALEFALADRHPYKLLARYFQVLARRQGG